MNDDDDSWADFGNLGLGYDDEHTKPLMKNELVIEDRWQPLFTSAVWSISATVAGRVISESSSAAHAHSEAFIKRWTRQMIRLNMSELKKLGVDVEEEYTKWGGDLKDLLP